MGFSDIGCYGSEIPTPNLDKLAAGGLRFTQFYNTGRCCPTRASLLTGLYPHQAGVGHMTEDRGEHGYRGDLNDRCVTIAEVLRSAGYRTAMTGKWHVTKFVDPADDAAEIQLAAAARFRALFRHHPGRRGLFPARSADLRERARASRAPVSTRPTLRGPRASSSSTRATQTEAVLPLSRLQRPALPAAGAAGRDRQVPRQVQDRLGQAPRAAARPADRTGHRGQGLGAVAAPAGGRRPGTSCRRPSRTASTTSWRSTRRSWRTWTGRGPARRRARASAACWTTR